jgi:hypothetical protein
MGKNTFILISGYVMHKMTAQVWPYWGRPSPSLIHQDTGPFVGSKSKWPKRIKNSLFGYGTWSVNQTRVVEKLKLLAFDITGRPSELSLKVS